MKYAHNDRRTKRPQTAETEAHTVRVQRFAAQMGEAERHELQAALDRLEMAALERKEITARIKQARKEAGLSQPEMADALGVIPRTYQNYESQKDPRVPWNLMGQISTITGKPTEWLLHGAAVAASNSNGNSAPAADYSADVRAQLERIETTLTSIVSVLDAMGEASESTRELFDSKLERLLRGEGRARRQAG